jgi:ATP-dependent Lhr-like helicase
MVRALNRHPDRGAGSGLASYCFRKPHAGIGSYRHGKTLAAFLVFIDRLQKMALEGTLKQELYLIYVSPLKSLAGDIRENLRRPLEGILRVQEQEDGRKPPSLSVAIRTGDTPQSERRRMLKSPPHILITTPESLYLMLTSKSGQSVLRTARWISSSTSCTP